MYGITLSTHTFSWRFLLIRVQVLQIHVTYYNLQLKIIKKTIVYLFKCHDSLCPKKGKLCQRLKS